MKVLPRIEFGDPILRKQARQLKLEEISSAKIQRLISDMRYTLLTKKLGVGLAAPQVGQDIALSVIAIRPTSHRPNVEVFDRVIINPKIVKTYGATKQMWEGCLSSGKDGLFAKVPRYNKVDVNFYDEKGNEMNEQFNSLRAQVMQHEIDHLNGVLFVDLVTDSSTYMTLSEYKKQVVAKRKK